MGKVRIACWVAWLVPVLSGFSLAFHDGGAAQCDGCHIMHEGSAVPGVDPALLLADSPSDLCLTCHAENHGAVLGIDPLLPPAEKGGGNFVFLMENNLNDAPDGLTNPIFGDAAGHSIVAPARGLVPDSRNSVSPGGSFPASLLGCTSCHDPHGNDNFRLLYGAGPVQGGLAGFPYPAPQAEGIGLAGVESNSNHTAYRSGMSQWCANCHGSYHDGDLSGFEHPSGESMDANIVSRYNRYEGDASPGGGSSATSYLAAVPFEDPGASTTTSSTQGPSGTSRVMCLTCHRAHASSAPYAGRWDFNVSLLGEDGVVSGSYPIPSPYDDPAQGSLCAKCHAGGRPLPGEPWPVEPETPPVTGSGQAIPQ